MKVRNFALALSRRAVAAQPYVAAALILTGFSGYSAPENTSPPAAESPRNRLAELIDAANYSKEDKEALKAGLAVALPGAATDHVSQQTIDIQIKNSGNDFPAAMTLVFNVADYLEGKAHEFANSEAFKRVGASNRKTVTAYLNEVVEQYRARAFEALLNRYDRPVSLPPNVPRTVSNADYRALLDVAVKAALLPYQKLAAAPAVVEKPVTVEKPAAVEKPVVVEKAAEVEKPVVTEKIVEVEKIVEKPVVVEKIVEVEKPVVVEKVVEKPVVVEKIVEVEKPVTVEKAVIAEKPIVAGKKHTLVVGDSIALLARLNKVSPEAIVEANPGLQPTRLQVGQVIIIPSSSSVKASKSPAPTKETPLLSAK